MDRPVVIVRGRNPSRDGAHYPEHCRRLKPGASVRIYKVGLRDALSLGSPAGALASAGLIRESS